MKAIATSEIPNYRKRFQQLWESILQHRVDASISLGDAGDKEIATLLRLEIDGGHCPLCGDSWREICFDNIFGQGRYFQPGCQCYPKCPRCQTWQYEEFSAGMLKARDWRCHACGFKLLTDDGFQRYGQRYEATWAGMTRRQQYIEAILGTTEQESHERRTTQVAKNRRGTS